MFYTDCVTTIFHHLIIVLTLLQFIQVGKWVRYAWYGKCGFVHSLFLSYYGPCAFDNFFLPRHHILCLFSKHGLYCFCWKINICHRDLILISPHSNSWFGSSAGLYFTHRWIFHDSVIKLLNIYTSRFQTLVDMVLYLRLSFIMCLVNLLSHWYASVQWVGDCVGLWEKVIFTLIPTHHHH